MSSIALRVKRAWVPIASVNQVFVVNEYSGTGMVLRADQKHPGRPDDQVINVLPMLWNWDRMDDLVLWTKPSEGSCNGLLTFDTKLKGASR